MKRIVAIFLATSTLVFMAGCGETNMQGKTSSISTSTIIEGSNSIIKENLQSQGAEADTKPEGNNNPADENEVDLLKQADIITQQLITKSFNKSVVDGNPLDDWAVNSFILTVPVVEAPEYIYKELVAAAELYEYPNKSVQQIAFEVFGIDNWVLEGGDVEYDDKRELYTSTLAFGIGGFYSCKDISSTLSTDKTTIVSKLILMDYSGSQDGPSLREIGEYKINYQIFQDNDQKFLRFLNLEKA